MVAAFSFDNKESTGTELVDTVESVVDPEAVEVVVAYLPYQELERSDGFPCTIDPSYTDRIQLLGGFIAALGIIR